MTDFESAFKKVSKLVEDFRQNQNKYLSSVFKEAEVRCDSLDKQINQEVYKLYGLIEEEIKIVKGKLIQASLFI